MAHPAKRPSFRFASLVSVAAVTGALLFASCDDSVPRNGGPNPGPTTPGAMPNPGSTMPPAQIGQTDFTTEEGAGNGSGNNVGDSSRATAGGAPGAAPAPTAPGAAESAVDKAPPGGRLADVEEADIYKVDKNRLFYLNTYRGFMIYDVNDTKNPQRVSRLPVFGYPVEMFISGNTVYALLRDALYLTQVGDKLQFERHNVSQLVVIDIADLRNPKVTKTIDIKGQLREGVSRKIENTIYVVSYTARNYYWGWRQDPAEQKERASVYSFNVANPADVKLVEELPIFEGGNINVNENGYSFNRNFQSVAISATSNALMVVENWYESQYQSGTSGAGGSSGVAVPRPACGSYSSTQFAKVSVIDISNPSGDIKLQAKFRTEGSLGDQFKMTYVFDKLANTGTFYGIFAKQVWQSSDCSGGSYTQNMFESWDVSVPLQPKKLDELQFGKPNETVRGSAFDPDRKVAYAITAQRIDPLYALGFENRADLKKLSEIDGLSGDMSVFRLVGDKKFLLAVGQDTSDTCTGFMNGTGGWRASKIAVSLIDVQNLAGIKLVQRQCVAIKNADWIGSGVQSNLDQAHKMLGMHFDGDVNVLTVPVYYSKRIENPNDWWWYRWETAVGMMTWDLRKYNPALSHLQQTVIENKGTFIHPHGEVTRSIVFTHEGATPRRMMINLSDTHVSIANLVDIDNPVQESEIEIAPFYNQIYRFGDHLVEQVQGKPQNWGSPSQDLATFRVKKAGGDMENAPVLAKFEVGQVYRVLKHNDSSLVLFRQLQDPRNTPMAGVYYPPTTEALVVDMRNPAAPRLAGKVKVPMMSVGYYPYWCGMGAYYGGFWFGQENNFATTERGLAFYTSEYQYEGPNSPGTQLNRLIFLDLRNPDAPSVSEQALPTTVEWGSFGLVADPVAPAGFYVTHRKKVGEQKTADGVNYFRYKYYAQRWEPVNDKWTGGASINIPGRLIRTWKSGAAAGEARMFLTQDMQYRAMGDGMMRYYVADHRLALLRQVTVAGAPAAELLDMKVLIDLYPAALLVDSDKLLINGRQQQNYWYGWGGDVAVSRPAVGGTTASSGAAALPSWETTSDRLVVFDMSGNKLGEAYNQATRMYNVQLMGTHAGKLFVNLTGNGSFYRSRWGQGGGGDGILVIDISNASAPRGVRFLRTLGFATHLEFFGDDVYVASGYFGLFHMNLNAPADLPTEPIM
jgi:Beta propeller domain/LVIVD repeat